MDRKIFVAVVAASLLFVAFVGDPLYIGLWYYLAIPCIAYLLSLPFRPKQYFLTGIIFAIVLTYIPYFAYNLIAERPDGLIGLGHLFSLFGLGLGIIVAGFIVKNRAPSSKTTFTLAFSISLLGFLINQVTVCNTVMYCGALLSFG